MLTSSPPSGLGFSICQRLIDEFLTTPSRDPLSHLILIISTRSVAKTTSTITSLRRHLQSFTQPSPDLQKRALAQDKPYDWRTSASRVHFLGAEVDLCDLRGIYRFASLLRGEGAGLRSPATEDGRPGLTGVHIPRLDVLYLNAGIGGWTGIPWAPAIWGTLTGLPESITYWKWLTFPVPAALAPTQSSFLGRATAKTVAGGTAEADGEKDAEEPRLGEIFCANVFGHYVLTHELMPLLSVAAGREPGERGRIVWISTLEPRAEDLPMDDLQGLGSKNPYYGSKRLTDLVVLTAALPGVRGVNKGFFAVRKGITPKDGEGQQGELVRPEMYVTQPGVVNTNISGITFWQSWFMLLGFYMARWLGSVWHPIEAYAGAVAPVWVGLAAQQTLDTLEPPLAGAPRSAESRAKCKWGSSTDWWGRPRVRKTEVPGWGWSGRVGEVIEQKGRASHAVELTAETREGFEADGRAAWAYLEGLRGEWEGRLGVGDVGGK